MSKKWLWLILIVAITVIAASTGWAQTYEGGEYIPPGATGPNKTLRALTVVELKVQFEGLYDDQRPNVGPPIATTKAQLAALVRASLVYLGVSIVEKRDTEALQRVPILKATSHFIPFKTSGGHDGTFRLALTIIEPMQSLRTHVIRWMVTWERSDVKLVPVYAEGIAFDGFVREFLAENLERPWKAHNAKQGDE